MKEQYKGLYGVYKLVKRLREPDGCPWDRKQTNLSLKENLIEESYEVIRAIDNNDNGNLKEELGDLLFLLFMHIYIKEQEGAFTMSGVCRSIINKMIHRHPHVFGDEKFNNEKELLESWENSKQKNTILDVVDIEPTLMSLRSLFERLTRKGKNLENIVKTLPLESETELQVREMVLNALKIIKQNKSAEEETKKFLHKIIQIAETR